MILKASAANGAESRRRRESRRRPSAPRAPARCRAPAGCRAARGGSRGRASSSGWTPLFLNQDPHSTGVRAIASVALRIAPLSSGTGISASSRISSTSASSWWETSSSRCSRAIAGAVAARPDLALVLLGAEIVEVVDRAHRDEVDDAGEVAARRRSAAGSARGARRGGRSSSHAALEVRAEAIHLVDVGDARHVALLGLAPHGLRLRLDAGDGVKTARSRRRARAASARPRR